MPALCTMNAFMHPSVVVAPNDPSLNDSPQDAPQEEDEKIEPLQEDDDFPSLLMSDGLSETSSDAGSKHSLISVSSAVVPPVKSSTGIAGRKRKSTEPHRSVRMPSPSTKMDAIQLNIYAPFRSNPSFLLYTSKTPSKASGRWNRERSVSDAAAAPSPMSHLYSTSAHLSSSSPLTQRPATAKRNFTPANRATKTLPDFVVQGFAATEGEDWELDMSKYQDTKGAPPIQWKRVFFLVIAECIQAHSSHSYVNSWCSTPAHS